MPERSERFSLVLTPTEKSLVEQLAEVEGGLSLAATIRRLIRQAASQQRLRPLTQSRQGPESTMASQGDHHDHPRGAANE